MDLQEIRRREAQILAQAERLLADAQLLLAHGRAESASALAILGGEEIGKALLHRWKHNWSDPLPSGPSAHLKKQIAVGCLLAAKDLLHTLGRRVFGGPDHVSLEEICNALEKSDAYRISLLALGGGIDKVKQAAFYKDVDDDVNTVEPLDAAAALEIIHFNRVALGLLPERDPTVLARSLYFSQIQNWVDYYKKRP